MSELFTLICMVQTNYSLRNTSIMIQCRALRSSCTQVLHSHFKIVYIYISYPWEISSGQSLSKGIQSYEQKKTEKKTPFSILYLEHIIHPILFQIHILTMLFKNITLATALRAYSATAVGLRYTKYNTKTCEGDGGPRHEANDGDCLDLYDTDWGIDFKSAGDQGDCSYKCACHQFSIRFPTSYFEIPSASLLRHI